VDSIGLVDFFIKEITLLGYKIQDVSMPLEEDGDPEENEGFYGSGFFISENGLFVTAYHVIEQARTIILRTINGRTVRAEVLIEDPSNDLAILSAVEGQNVESWLPLGDSDYTKIGDRINIVGYPVPNLIGANPEFASGFISADSGIGDDPTRFEFRAPIQLGCSGGAILNTRNEVIGITSEQTNDEWVLVTRTGTLPADINIGVKANYARVLLELYSAAFPWKTSSHASLEDAINSSALVLINTQNIPADIQSAGRHRIILVEFSRAFLCYILQYTIFEFNEKRNDIVVGEILTSGYIGGVPISNPYEIVEAFIKEMRKISIL